MKYVSEVAAIVNFEDGNQSDIIVPPLVALRDLDAFIKGYVQLVRSYVLSYHTLSLYTISVHTWAPWIEVKSSKTGQFYYYNRTSNESVYTLPQDAILPYGKANFFKVPWTRASAEDFDVVQLAQEVLHLDF
ncbi:unnamed protein product [Dibothriocephalus latus]|uniref:WW domain-containing protein n=1 Tax=Dibothriocephalus latus TaxID=60516 RepID=A0A3P7LA10_DIBLA|nr:unnamed protein product [Dibothriocephalus latus]